MRALFGFNEVDLSLRKLLLGEEIVMPTVRESTIVRFLEEHFAENRQIAKIGTSRLPR